MLHEPIDLILTTLFVILLLLLLHFLGVSHPVALVQRRKFPWNRLNRMSLFFCWWWCDDGGVVCLWYYSVGSLYRIYIFVTHKLCVAPPLFDINGSRLWSGVVDGGGGATGGVGGQRIRTVVSCLLFLGGNPHQFTTTTTSFVGQTEEGTEWNCTIEVAEDRQPHHHLLTMTEANEMEGIMSECWISQKELTHNLHSCHAILRFFNSPSVHNGWQDLLPSLWVVGWHGAYLVSTLISDVVIWFQGNEELWMNPIS